MMVIAISFSLIVFSGMLYARTLVLSNTASGYISTNPASARITLEPGVMPDRTDEFTATAKAEPGVIDATLRQVTNVKLQKESGGLKSLQLFVAAAADPMRIATFKIEEGAGWPPPPDGILIERSTLESLKLKVGDKVDVIAFDGRPVQLTVTGSVHDQSLALAGQTAGVGYIQAGTLPLLGRPPALNQLVITVADRPGLEAPSRDRDTIVRAALMLVDRLKAMPGIAIKQVAVPTPYEHPHQAISYTVLSALSAFGLLSLILSSILIATLFNGLLTQQIPQIGMMKAIGARCSRILQLYMSMVLMVSGLATVLSFVPGLVLGRTLAEMVLSSALNIDVASLSIPWSVLGTVLFAGLFVPLLIALLPLLRASHRTVREALDERGVAERQGRITTGLFSWLGRLRGVDRKLMVAFRNLFRRQARLFLSVGLLATGGAIFVSGFNVMAGFQAIPNTIYSEQRWDIEIRLDEPESSSALTAIVEKVSGVRRVETWNIITTSIQNVGEIDVTRTYPDQGHGSLGLSAIPPSSSMIIPPQIAQGRWLNPDDTDTVILPPSIRQTIPDVKVGDSVQLSVEDRPTTWRVIGIASGLGGSCPCVTQKGFEGASGRQDQANVVRIITDQHDKDARVSIGQAAAQALTKAGIKPQAPRSIDGMVASAEGHSVILVGVILLIASTIGIVGLIGLGSTMSTNVIERTREFGVMKAIGASGSTIQRLVIFEGIFLAAVSCVVAAIPAIALTWAMGAVLGNLFLSTPIPLEVSAQGIVIWLVVVVFGAALATLVPAVQASRLTVREALAYL
ncbi:MAG: FtsX-like permease family protein [Chloroflexi bacterium]|nr:FtsX-like permease family protein [Chloroflexota bacterium]